MDSKSVSIRIKSASHRCEDLELSCNLSSTVLNIKKIIQLKNPLHPGVSEQRLIYSGHLLDDNQLIRDIVYHNPSDVSQTDFTFHLACTSKSYVPYGPGENQKSRTVNPTTVPQPEQPPMNINQSNFATNAPVGGIPPDVLTLHQIYVEQMMTFMAQWSQGTSTNFGATPYQYQFSETAQANANYAQVQEELLRAARNDARVENVPGNEAARVRAEDEENPRDMLDWMYTFSRLILVFSVVYFYSNFTRFFLVVIFTALVMVMQRRHQGNNAEGEARVQDAAEAHPVPQQAAPIPTNQPEPNRDESENGQDVANGLNANTDTVEGNKSEEILHGSPDENVESEDSPQEIVLEPPVPPRLHQLRDISWTFLTTFFTSLIPDTPQNN